MFFPTSKNLKEGYFESTTPLARERGLLVDLFIINPGTKNSKFYKVLP